VARRDDLSSVAGGSTDVQRIAEHLVALANERGGPDNITVVAARFGGEGLEPPEPSDEVGYHNLDIEEVSTVEYPAPAPVVAPERRTGSPRTILITAVIIAVIIAVALVLLF
jgi:hypothetical protein